MTGLMTIAQDVLEQLQSAGLDVSLAIKTVAGKQLYTLSFSSPVSTPVEEAKMPTSEPAEVVTPLRTPAWHDTYNRLRELRTLLAKREAVSCFIVFGNKTLEEMVAKMPKTREELSRVKGVGPMKLDVYGASVLAVLGGTSPGEAFHLCGGGPSSTGSTPPASSTPPTASTAPLKTTTRDEKRQKKEVALNKWVPSPQLLRYYREGTPVSPNTRLGQWLALKNYRIEDVLAGRVPGIPGVL